MIWHRLPQCCPIKQYVHRVVALLECPEPAALNLLHCALLLLQSLSKSVVKEFKTEVSIMYTLKHPNIVLFMVSERHQQSGNRRRA